MKIYFYGTTKEDTEKKCHEFWNNNNFDINKMDIVAICVFSFLSTDKRIPKDYRCHAFCEFNFKK